MNTVLVMKSKWASWSCVCVLSVLMLCFVPVPDLTAAPEDSVRIGLVLNPETEIGRSVRQAAELAVEHANQEGGFNGRPFNLIVRSDEGLWGGGITQMSRLILNDDVWVVLGSLDGESAHLVEQVINKRHTPYITFWVGDPTLAEAGITYFFRANPDDVRQTEAIVAAIKRSGARTLVTVEDGSYDGRLGRTEFVKTATRGGLQVLARHNLKEEDSRRVLREIRRTNPDGVVLYGLPPAMADFLRDLRGTGVTVPVYGPLLLSDDRFVRAAATDESPVWVVKPGYVGTEKGEWFRKTFEQKYGVPPRPAAAYGYDAVMVAVRAIRSAGLDRFRIRDHLAETHYEDALTGPIRFDEKGNRIGEVELFKVSK